MTNATRSVALLFAFYGVSTLAWSSPSIGLARGGQVSLSSPLLAAADAWNGEVVSNTADGKINGCSITAVGEEPVVEWVITIDG